MADRTNRCTLVTGTDTGSGKTLVSCAVVAALRARGLDVGVYKPIETGCTRARHGLQGSDVDALVTAAGNTQRRETAASYLYEMPAAPLVAAETVGERIDPLRLAADFERLAQQHDTVIVEGAGGLLVPIADGYTYLDFARQLRLPVLCVVGSRLGCVNHALLTLRVLEQTAIYVLGYAVNTLAPERPGHVSADANRRTIARFASHRDLGVFPYIEEAVRTDYDALGRIAEETLDIDHFI